ncbi:DUF2971 domain-containing protein [Mycolicibacterium sp. CH28]|uniref:DUF2971 domain-containing protein n=1 Tax=Mycolicibacterium sp. CH28 TaxID=2512237 RepID=UPI001080DA69|nr:DUF2971 domain-containing protein [Mycolicibacterium sp. CH28]TGD90565.1 DUF2971 domain-containing protein [Mycolicibacterium sp. CH28]
MVNEQGAQDKRQADYAAVASSDYQRLTAGRLVRNPIDRKQCLYHYTSAAGLKGILESGSLWATDTAFLNDRKEIRYAGEVLEQRMRARLEPYIAGLVQLREADSTEYNRVMVLGAARAFLSYFALDEREMIIESNDIYINGATFVTCLSEDHDQLGQWRAYGQDGYAIGFYRSGLEGVAPVFGPVKYGDAAVAELCDEAIRYFEQREPTGQQYEHDGYVEAVTYCLPRIAFVKHPAFEQEKEFRLAIPRYDVDLREVKVRLTSSLVPYIECNFNKQCVAEIVIGPGGNLHSVRAVRALLKQYGYDPEEIQITHSNAPFRG